MENVSIGNVEAKECVGLLAGRLGSYGAVGSLSNYSKLMWIKKHEDELNEHIQWERGEGIEEYLIEKTRVVKDGLRISIHNYHCFEDFVLQNGLYLGKAIPLPSNMDRKRSSDRKRIINLQRALLSLCDKSWHYCEGFVLRRGASKPVLHAWMVNEKVEIIDPIWNDVEGYYGVIFEHNHAVQWWAEKGAFFSLIDNPSDDYPLLRLSPPMLEHYKVKVDVKVEVKF